ncbi:MAG: hypothetical protein ACPLXP_00905 [Microgenomates group bacterium]
MLILHGENIQASRQYLREKIKKFSGEVIKLEGEKLTLTEFQQAVESQSIFKNDKLVVIFSLFSRKPGKEKEKLLKYCRQENPKNLIIWEGEKIDGRILKHFPGAEIKLFELAKIIYKFLDYLSPRNKRYSLALFHQCLKQETPEKIFYYLCRHIENLIIAADLGEEGLTKFPSWKQKKLITQANNFGIQKLITTYNRLLEVDYQQKTGRAPFSLISHLDLLIASL